MFLLDKPMLKDSICTVLYLNLFLNKQQTCTHVYSRKRVNNVCKIFVNDIDLVSDFNITGVKQCTFQ